MTSAGKKSSVFKGITSIVGIMLLSGLAAGCQTTVQPQSSRLVNIVEASFQCDPQGVSSSLETCDCQKRSALGYVQSRAFSKHIRHEYAKYNSYSKNNRQTFDEYVLGRATSQSVLACNPEGTF